MIRSRVTISKSALPGTGSSVNWDGSPITNTAFWAITGSDGKIYFCSNEIDATTVAARVTGTMTKYTGGYVYHTYILNNEATGDAAKYGAIASNEFLHVNVTGVKNNVFGGTPGDSTTGETPTDPITDPEEPITTAPAYLVVDVSVANWALTAVETDL
jgi:hypothetical protein